MLVFGKEQDKSKPVTNPGDSVFGFVTINEGIKVHKKIVQMLLPCSQLRVSHHAAKWIDSSQQEFKAIINITGMDTLVLQMSSQK
jgi:GTP pyrophosphokinase